MREYEVYGHATVICSMRVKANSQKEAIKKANEEFGSLTNYVGMGCTKTVRDIVTRQPARQFGQQ